MQSQDPCARVVAFSSDLGMIIVSRWLVAVCFGHGCFVPLKACAGMAKWLLQAMSAGRGIQGG